VNIALNVYPVFAINFAMIQTKIDELLKERERSLYWLAKEASVAYTTLWKLKTGTSQGISFGVLDRLCSVLQCAVGDILVRKANTKK
jgi:putative transcriptional regulator